METLAELTTKIVALTAESKTTAETIVKIGSETGNTLAQVTALNAKILELQEQINNGADTTALGTAVNELVVQSAATLAQAKATDDLTPDEVVVPPPVE